MAEFTADAVQIVNPGETVIFTNTTIPCQSGNVRHSDGTGSVLLNGGAMNQSGCCCVSRFVEYQAKFGANIAVATGGTVGEISLAFVIDGATVPASTMSVTPAAVEEFFNVSRDKSVPVWRGCCQTLGIRNISDQPVSVRNASLIVTM